MKYWLAVAVIMFCTTGWSKFYDGNRLYTLCKADERAYDTGACVGFIAGVSDTLSASKNQREPSRRICLPRRTTQEELRQVVVDYLALVPQLRGYDANFLVELALRAAYPCAA